MNNSIQPNNQIRYDSQPQQVDRAGSPIDTFPVTYSSRAIREVYRVYEEQQRTNQAMSKVLGGVKDLDLAPSAP